MKREASLKSILGICVNQGWPELFESLKPIGFNYARIDANHDIVEKERGEYDWWWLDRSVKGWQDMTGFPPFLSIFGLPAWGLSNLEQYELDWRQYVDEITDRYWWLPDWGITVETNIKRVMGGMSMLDFFEKIVIPASLVIHSKGKRVISPAPTIQWWESRNTRDRARNHMNQIRQYGKGFCDKFDFHSYGTSGKSVCEQNERFLWDQLRRWPEMGEFWCSETGFSNSREGVPLNYTGDAILHKIQNWVPWLWEHGGWFERIFLYRAWDGYAAGIHRNGILNPDLSWGPAAYFLQQSLQEVREVEIL